MFIPALIKWFGLSININQALVTWHRRASSTNPYFEWLFSRDRSCPSSMCWRFSRNKTSKLHSNIRTSERIFYIFIYTGKHFFCNMIILELISFFNHFSCHHFGGLRAGYPFSKRKIKKKVALKKGATRFRITAGHERCRDRHVSIVPMWVFSWRWKWWFKTNPKQGSSDENMIEFILHVQHPEISINYII